MSTLVYDRVYESLAKETNESIAGSSLELIPLPVKQAVEKNLFHGGTLAVRQVLESDVAYLHHTSGTSTGLPKPIPQTHRAAIGVLPTLNSGHETATFSTTPLYHGGIADCFRAWTSESMIWLFPGADVPITPSNILKSLVCSHRSEETHRTPKVGYFSSVPYVLQTLAAEDEGLNSLKDMKLVGVGGAALPQDVGDHLVQMGVNLVSRFGSAECGFLMSSYRNFATDKAWQYLRSNASPHLQFEPQEDGLAELVICPSWPHMAKRNRDDGSYATADLFESHSSIPKAWKYHSRADSQLTLITGKKFDPAPIEDAIATSPLLRDVLIFGNGQQLPGALLFRADSSADMADDELLSAIWPSIEKLNADSQAHTRLSRSMLTVMPSAAGVLEKSSKGTILRAQAEKKYAPEITRAYKRGPDVSANGMVSSSKAGVADEEVATAVSQVIQHVLETSDSIPEDGDLFSLGVDSAHCMQIRAILQTKILQSPDNILPLNVVYDCGTIGKLSRYLIGVRQGQKMEIEDETQMMQDLVQEYSSFDNKSLISDKAPSSNPIGISKSSSQIVVLTGATGALGAHILSLLRSAPDVLEVHCLIRAASPTAAHERISKSLIARNKAPLNPTSSKISCHPCKLSDPALGLPPSIYRDLATRTTLIIHAAWAVNFSMRLSSFVKDHIAGLRNLINFALASQAKNPAHFLFCSSTASVLGAHRASPIPERISHDPSSASPLGYSRSKWVAESICEQAYLNTRMKDNITVIRIGQLCGDTESGIWNITEAWPLMLSSVKVTLSLPDLKDEKLDWLPVDIAALAVLETAQQYKSSSNGSSNIPVYHLLNPCTESTWHNLLTWAQKLSPTAFDIVSPSTWVSQLDNLTDEAGTHPARKLLGLWRDAYCNNDNKTETKTQTNDDESSNDDKKSRTKTKEEKEEASVFEMDETKKAAPTIQDVKPISEEQFAKMWNWIEKEMK